MPHSVEELSRFHAEALLRWYVEMGVDVALDDAQQDRYAVSVVSAQQESSSALLPHEGDEENRVAAPAPRVLPASPPALATALPDQNAQTAAALAGNAQTLEELRQALQGFEGCALKRTAQQLVFSDGTPGSRVMLIGEAPGRDEDREGKPFVGRAGQLLTRMLNAIGLERGNVYIANVVPWRPPGNRTPTAQEVATCLPFILRQIALADPEYIVLLGGSAASALTGTREGVTKTRGRWFDIQVGSKTYPALVTLHPAYLLRSPIQKKLVWQDLRMLAARLKS